MYMVMDKVKLGSDTVDPDDFVRRAGQSAGSKREGGEVGDADVQHY